MNDLSSEQLQFKVDEITLSGILERPNTEAHSAVLVLHPHPLFGGDMYNPVIQTLVNTFLENGYVTFRFDFRGARYREEFAGVAGAVEDCRAAVDLLESLGLKLTGIAGYSCLKGTI